MIVCSPLRRFVTGIIERHIIGNATNAAPTSLFDSQSVVKGFCEWFSTYTFLMQATVCTVELAA